MNNLLNEALEAVLVQWKRNAQTSILEGAEDAATLLEYRFYAFIEVFRKWWMSCDPKPNTLEDALELPEVQVIVNRLPAPLYLPFENELDLLVDGIDQENDEKYD
jgi:hypothetical protein